MRSSECIIGKRQINFSQEDTIMEYNLGYLAIFAVLLFYISNSLQANSDFQRRVYNPSEGESLPYRIHIPANADKGEKYPLVLLFHGAGERGKDNKKQLAHGAKKILEYSRKMDMPLILLAPQCPKAEQWVNTPWGADSHSMPEKASKSMQLTINLLQELQKSLPVDRSRIYVTGLSMGGFATWDIIQRHPDFFAAALPVCGGGDPLMAELIKDIPIWAFHGSLDKVVKTKRSREMVSALQKAGGKIKYTEYQGVAHNSWKKAYSDPEALKWLLSQKKGK